MVSSFFTIIIEVLVMLLILVCMVLLLVGLQYYLLKGQRHGEMDDSLSDTLRRQIDNESGVISRYNVFHRFFAEDDDFSDSSVPRFFSGNQKRSRSLSALPSGKALDKALVL